MFTAPHFQNHDAAREYLEALDWNKQPPAPPLPEEIGRKTTERYISAYNILTGRNFPE